MTNRENEVKRIDAALAEMRRARTWARILLAIVWLPEKLGIRAAHEFADHQRDIIDEMRYSIEEFGICRSRVTGESDLVEEEFPGFAESRP